MPQSYSIYLFLVIAVVITGCDKTCEDEWSDNDYILAFENITEQTKDGIDNDKTLASTTMRLAQTGSKKKLSGERCVSTDKMERDVSEPFVLSVCSVESRFPESGCNILDRIKLDGTTGQLLTVGLLYGYKQVLMYPTFSQPRIVQLLYGNEDYGTIGGFSCGGSGATFGEGIQAERDLLMRCAE